MGGLLSSARSTWKVGSSSTALQLQLNFVLKLRLVLKAVIAAGRTCQKRNRCRYWGQSGHGLVHCTCLLLTQSGHWQPDDQRSQKRNCPMVQFKGHSVLCIVKHIFKEIAMNDAQVG